MRAALERRLLAFWHAPPPSAARLLQPLEAAFIALACRRREGAARSARPLPVPVIVVGNLAVGGTGKTPLVIALARLLTRRGMRVGVVSRGYGGRERGPLGVHAGTDVRHCGDEAALLAARVDGPVWVGRDRARAARELLAATPVEVILADDGLQHYRLARSMEICVLDSTRWLGNGHCLPLGPLREPPARLAEVDYVLANGDATAPSALEVHGRMRLLPGAWRQVRDDVLLGAGAPAAGERVHAVAGIGNPQRFFATLRALGLDPIEHPFADHHRFRECELQFGDRLRVVMTEKDAVKCRRFAAPHWLALGIEAQLPDSLGEAVLRCIATHPPRLLA
ncbi:MAG: Tetraacyldisaccharide 4'-kinase [Pseudomonadales bacterium]|nr:Tetraacyldisaccharide 4'-kinase [Pseudomonadales bacterium]